MSSSENIYKHLPGILIVLAAMAIGMATYQDYGMAYNEQAHTHMGFDMLLTTIERRLHISGNPRDVMLMRHLVTHMFFLLSSLFGYVLFLRLFKSQFIAVLGLLMLLLYPPVYAHSFFNATDIPVLCMTLFSLAACYAAFSSGKAGHFLLIGIACGFTAGMHPIGLLCTLIVFIFLSADIIAAINRKERPKALLLAVAVFIVSFFATLSISSPLPWRHAFTHLLSSYSEPADLINSKVLLNGKLESAQLLPTTYFPIYFLITIPVLWLVTAGIGIIRLAASVVRNPLAFCNNAAGRILAMSLAIFMAPIFMVLLYRPPMYDGWRHLYYIYPSFIVLALFSIDKLWQTRYKLYVASLCSIQLAYLCYFMLANHPLQQNYFNSLVSHDREYIRKHYDFEYSGASSLQALKYLLWRHPEGKIKIGMVADSQAVRNNLTILKPQDRERFEVMNDCSQADYFITNHRWHPENYPNKVEFKITVLNSSAVTVYRVQPQPPRADR